MLTVQTLPNLEASVMHSFWEIIRRTGSKSSPPVSLSVRDIASAWLSRFNAQWNPTGDIFDVRPDLALLSLEELADAVISMRAKLRLTSDELMRAQLSRFERQYSFALYRRAKITEAAAVVVNELDYRIVLTAEIDVFLLHLPPRGEKKVQSASIGGVVLSPAIYDAANLQLLFS